MDTRQVVVAEVKLINQLLMQHGIKAGTSDKLAVVVRSSFIAYGLKLGPGEKAARIEAVCRELSNELTAQRVRTMPGYTGRAVVRLRDYPLALEVPHPQPVPLDWRNAPLRMGRFMALAGRSYGNGEAHEEYIDLERHHHVLVAAMSGGGKSTLMRMALLTLALNTSPDDLSIILVDLKNDDLQPFRAMPHVIGYAGDIDRAVAAIEHVHTVKAQRIQSQEKPFRLLLVIDELAELGQAKDAIKLLGSILSTGRSLGINVWAGTQYPTADTIGSVVNASFTTRFAGIVDSKTAAVAATKRAGSGAELLQTPGDFLRVGGTEVLRMKAYNLDQESTTGLIGSVVKRWNGRQGERLDFYPSTTPVVEAKQDEIDAIADKIGDLWSSGASKNALSKLAFDGKSYGGSYASKIDQAIVRLEERKASSTTTTVPAVAVAPRAVEVSAEDSSSSRSNIIRFPRVASGD